MDFETTSPNGSQLLQQLKSTLTQYAPDYAGAPMKEIQAWLGHSTIGTTANIYTHLDENSKINSANAIIGILEQKKDTQSISSPSVR